jgi:hypothetical protein
MPKRWGTAEAGFDQARHKQAMPRSEASIGAGHVVGCDVGLSGASHLAGPLFANRRLTANAG